jgi:hypothetical protein
MSNYNFRNFFLQKNPIHNDEYVTNGFILIKKSELKKSQLEFVNSFEMNESTINNLKYTIKNESEKPVVVEFIPHLIKTNVNVLIMNCDNENILFSNVAIMEEYYNFIIALKCKVFIVNNNSLNPLSIYNSNNEFVGILLPYRITESVITDTQDYKEYLNNKEVEQETKEQKSKKCLYISNNKAMVRHQQLTCIADLLQDEKYRNVYVEENKNDYGEVFVDLGIICMGTGRTLDRKTDAEGIEYSIQELSTITLDEYKAHITKALNDNQFINMAEIKLMELTGEPTEYIQTLTEHRQKVLDLRDKENREREQKRQQEEQDYIGMENAKADKQIREAEQNIVNKEGVKNSYISVYKSRYDYNNSRIILYLMKQYNINVPLKTQGWINNALEGILYDTECDEWTYRYYTSSANSTVFQKYLNELVKKINEKYSKVA